MDFTRRKAMGKGNIVYTNTKAFIVTTPNNNKSAILSTLSIAVGGEDISSEFMYMHGHVFELRVHNFYFYLIRVKLGNKIG